MPVKSINQRKGDKQMSAHNNNWCSREHCPTCKMRTICASFIDFCKNKSFIRYENKKEINK